MLQQTQVITVVDYFGRFMKAFPTLSHLAASPVDGVTALWSGLGYYARARNLHRASEQLVAAGHTDLPLDFEALLSLPGIGRSTAGAILSLSGNLSYPILDGNVRRVLGRYFGMSDEPVGAGLKRYWLRAETQMPIAEAQFYNQGLMDLGALICTPRAPSCIACPLNSSCVAFQEQAVDQYPRAAKKIKVKAQTIQWVVLTAGAHVFLIRRPESGIWGGLYAFPEWLVEDVQEQLSPKTVLSVQSWPAFQHILTHRKLRIEVQHIRLRRRVKFEGGAWYDGRACQHLGKPAPVDQILKEMLPCSIA